MLVDRSSLIPEKQLKFNSTRIYHKVGTSLHQYVLEKEASRLQHMDEVGTAQLNKGNRGYLPSSSTIF